MITLTAAKVIVKGDEDINLTLTYPLDIGGDEAILFERGLTGSTVISKIPKSPSGQVTFTIKSSIQGEHTYWAVVTPCWVVLNCDYSNDVKISVTDAECSDIDIGCKISKFFTLDTKIIMAIVVIVVLLAIYTFYVPKGRK